jgi:hypothetical protein
MPRSDQQASQGVQGGDVMHVSAKSSGEGAMDEAHAHLVV